MYPKRIKEANRNKQNTQKKCWVVLVPWKKEALLPAPARRRSFTQLCVLQGYGLKVTYSRKLLSCHVKL